MEIVNTPKLTQEQKDLALISAFLHATYELCVPPGADTPPGKMGDAAKIVWQAYVDVRALCGDIVK